MAKFLQLALWNANGLTQHIEELKMFICNHNTDVMLFSETHFTDKGYLKLPKYTVYHTNHPAATARGGTAIIIKTTITHHLQSSYKQDFLQATSVSVEDSDGPLTILAVYLPPKHAIKQEELEEFYNSLGHQFIAGGDYNAKHTDWVFRLITPRGPEVLKTMGGERKQLKTYILGRTHILAI
jgi:exonuclease III